MEYDWLNGGGRDREKETVLEIVKLAGRAVFFFNVIFKVKMNLPDVVWPIFLGGILVFHFLSIYFFPYRSYFASGLATVFRNVHIFRPSLSNTRTIYGLDLSELNVSDNFTICFA